MAFRDNMAGGTAPMGPFWDPLGLGNTDDKQLQKFREAEVKHSRVAMLAALGMLVQTKFHPFFLTSDVQLPPASFHLQAVSQNFPLLPAILVAAIASVEAVTIAKGWSKNDYRDDQGQPGIANLKENYVPGDLGFDPLGLLPSDEAGAKNMRNKELNNGRLAMISIWGMWAQEVLANNPILVGDSF